MPQRGFPNAWEEQAYVRHSTKGIPKCPGKYSLMHGRDIVMCTKQDAPNPPARHLHPDGASRKTAASLLPTLGWRGGGAIPNVSATCVGTDIPIGG